MWRKIGAGLLFLYPILLAVPRVAIRWGLEMILVGGDFDFVATMAGWPDWLRDSLSFVVNPPPWFPALIGAFGLILVAWPKTWWPRRAAQSVRPKIAPAPPNQSSARLAASARVSARPTSYPNDSGAVTFDYSTHNGTVRIGSGDRQFGIKFSSASNTSIHLYNDGAGTRRIARAKAVRSGENIKFSMFDSSSRSYTIQQGEHFLVENSKGFFLQGRVADIKCETHGADRYEVQFDYQINPAGSDEFKAL